MIPDMVNGLFEFFGGCLLFLNVQKILKDKIVKGISIIPTILFFLWGIWNLYYYPSLNQRFSFLGGIFVVLANGIWISLVIYYRKQGKWLHKNKIL